MLFLFQKTKLPFFHVFSIIKDEVSVLLFDEMQNGTGKKFRCRFLI